MKYKISKYTIVVNREDDIILFNTLSGAMLYFNDPSYISIIKLLLEEKNDIEISSTNDILLDNLKKSQIILEQNIIETDIVKMSYLHRFKNNRTLRFLIYVTDDCNFNCIYCPQNHLPKYMTIETMQFIINSIENLLATGNYDALTISWFGGEPLMNLKIIEKGMLSFTNLAKKYNVSVHSGITTNGYLLNKKAIDTLFRNNITEFQITVDGDREVHDKNRHLKNGCGTWDTIWNNLQQMKNYPESFVVNLRINVNMDNVESIPQFINKIKLLLDERFIVRIQPIIKMGVSTHSTDAKFCSLLESQIIQLNLYDYMSNLKCEDLAIENVIKPFGLMCSCSDPNYYVIRTDGKICKCELEVEQESNDFGEISKNGFALNGTKLANYVVPSSNPECMDCYLYPLCLGLTCPYKRSTGMSCSLKNTFLLEEFISTIAEKYIRIQKNDI